MDSRAFIFLANGFEDIEAIAPLDALRRGGVDVELVSISDEPFVTSSHGVTVGADTTLDMGVDVGKDDIMIFPGGMPGTRRLAECVPLMEAMKEHYSEGGLVAAICAAPGYVIGQIDDLSGVEITCFDGCEGLALSKGAKLVKRPAVTSGNIITGRSAGYAVDFALEILKKLKGEEMMKTVGAAMLLTCE